jgi:excisionase family DNA binding protein
MDDKIRISEAASILGVSVQAIHKRIKTGDLTAEGTRGQKRVSRADVEKLKLKVTKRKTCPDGFSGRPIQKPVRAPTKNGDDSLEVKPDTMSDFPRVQRALETNTPPIRGTWSDVEEAEYIRLLRDRGANTIGEINRLPSTAEILRIVARIPKKTEPMRNPFVVREARTSTAEVDAESVTCCDR